MSEDTQREARAVLELRKLELDIEKLKLDVGTAARLRRFDLALRLLPTITILVSVLGFAFTVWQYVAEQAKNRESAEHLARQAAEAGQREFMKPLLEKQQELYFDAAAAAATIASTNDESERRNAERKFWMLYWGPLVMVESTDVSGAMKAFGRCVSREDQCQPGEFQRRSLALASTLEISMLRTWNAKPDEFIKGQFDYR
jgi:hypothetical protein